MTSLLSRLPSSAAGIVAGSWHYRPRVSTECLTLIVTVVFTLLYNIPFWQGALDGHAWSAPGTWLLIAGYAVVLTSLQYVVFLLFVSRWTAKPLLALLILVAATVSYFTGTYGTYFDTTMITNVLQTDSREAGELLTESFALHMAVFALLPIALLHRVRIPAISWRRAVLRRLGYLSLAAIALIASVLLTYHSLSPLMRNRPELRYLVTPGNYLVSMGRVLTAHDSVEPQQRLPLESDAKLAAHPGHKPALLVIVVGETARAANWGLNGYHRQTTPQLAQRDVINYPDVSSCGTSTAVSVPCMFSPLGHEDYDESYIDSHESLLDVLRHAGVNVLWLDNQSGCKGVCDGVASEYIAPDDYPALCQDGRCLDGALAKELKRRVERSHGDTVIVLHELGNHGPSYYQRYPEAFRRFTPTCDSADLSQCSQQRIVNSYDNAILYNDTVLSDIIDFLARQQRFAASMVYLSDHGESLGEHGLYLHGLPYAIAPDEQTHVPMIWWLSKAMQRRASIDSSCLRSNADRPHSHANLFHSVLGIMGVTTQVYRPEFDIVSSCR
ncbi:phosphoethanolamine--lipid A transferase [Halomonas sp. HP20-15]|uniref:phosphoethanolamine transferase n=1 Tax=Halomonas sp. HP20-15 TaxID=3085901 RepID=UPI0029824CB8|nr:phosphoethanolamine--lipid A transferase [Halomonas sp. HP20-15]MDW5377829.1 phosphoethanolamine--lipid A transferase [Halomonas sp. HP20-15]